MKNRLPIYPVMASGKSKVILEGSTCLERSTRPKRALSRKKS